MAKTPGGECHFNKSPTSDDFDVTIRTDQNNLVGFTVDFIEEVERVGGNSSELCHRLLRSHSSEDIGFRAGQL